MMLGGVRVVECARSTAVRYCGWMLAANGAEVTVVRPAGTGHAGDEWSDSFLDHGKRGVDTASLGESTADAHIVIADPEFDWTAVTPAADPPVTGTVDDFGPEGPYAHWQGNELILSSLGGAALYTTDRQGTPVYGFGDRYQYLCGIYLYTALTSCLLTGSPRSDEAPIVRVSAYETVVSLLPYPTVQYHYNGSLSVLEQSGPRYVCRCSDGYVVIYAGRDWQDIVAVLGDPSLASDDRFVETGARFAHSEELNKLFDAWCADRTVADAAKTGERHNVAITAVATPTDVLGDPALAARDAWRIAPTPRGPGRVPALPYTVDGHRPDLPVEVTR